MFALLTMYPGDNIASMYATSMHSGSGYLVTSPDVSAARDGVVDDPPSGITQRVPPGSCSVE